MKRIYFALLANFLIISSYAQPNMVEISHYIFPEFTRGFVLMKDGELYTDSLNYNSITEEMIFNNGGKKMAISESEIELIDTIFIKERIFITLNSKLVEIIYHSGWDVYVEHKCKVKQPGVEAGYGGTSQVSSVSSISSYAAGRFYDLKLPDDYEIRPYFDYWIKKDGELMTFTNMRQLKKIFKDRDELLKDYMKMHDVKYADQESIVQLIKYLESS